MPNQQQTRNEKKSFFAGTGALLEKALWFIPVVVFAKLGLLFSLPIILVVYVVLRKKIDQLAIFLFLLSVCLWLVFLNLKIQ